jgi:hypothetical protein
VSSYFEERQIEKDSSLQKKENKEAMVQQQKHHLDRL